MLSGQWGIEWVGDRRTGVYPVSMVGNRTIASCEFLFVFIQNRITIKFNWLLIKRTLEADIDNGRGNGHLQWHLN